MSEQPPIRLKSKLLVLGILAREILRAACVPLHVLLSLWGTRRRRENLQVLLSQQAEDPRLANERARKAMAERLGSSVPPKRIFLSCGEASGERHASAFLEELQKTNSDCSVYGFGGKALESLGMRVEINLVDHAVMGVKRVLAQVPFYLRVVGRYLDLLRAERPDVVVLVDNPGLHLILASLAKKRGIPVLYYICPQYWAWGPWRMHRFRRSVDAALAILPFEPRLFEKAGVPCAFAGNPLMQAAALHQDREKEELLALLPGSRRAELGQHLRPMLQIYQNLRREYPSLRAVIPQSNERRLEELRRGIDEAGLSDAVEVAHGDPFESLKRARVALVKSGTIAMQAAVAGTALCVCYKLGGRFDPWLQKGLVLSPWIAGPNLVLGRELVPEHCFQDESAWLRVEASVRELLEDEAKREEQERGLAEIRARLDGEGASRELCRLLGIAVD